ncbi:MAG: hypothetical protein ACKODA_00025 [Nevskiaceae bacterium]
MTLEWRREPEIIWPPETSGRPVVPGRPEVEEFFETFGQRSNRDSLDGLYREVLGRLRGDNGGRGFPRPPGGEIIEPDEEPGPTEACAYYLSFRFGPAWGIYIGVDCWVTMARYLHRNGIPAEIAVDEAFMYMFLHEYFHFAVDTSTVIFERAVGKSTGSYQDHWVAHHRANNPSLLEEALANAHAYKNAGKRATGSHGEHVRSLLAHWMRRQPPGYRDFEDVCAGRGSLGEARSQLMSEIMGIHRRSNSSVPGLESLFHLPSFSRSGQKPFGQKFEGKPLNIYFY